MFESSGAVKPQQCVSQLEPGIPYGQRVAAFLRDPKTLLCPSACFVVPACHAADERCNVQSVASVETLLLRFRMREHFPADPIPELEVIATDPAPQCVNQLQTRLATALRNSAISVRQQDILALAVESCVPRPLFRATEPSLGLLRKRNIVPKVLDAGLVLRVRLGQALQRVLPHRLQKVISTVIHVERHQRLPHQLTQQVEHVHVGHIAADANGFRAVEGEASGEHRKSHQ